ncbi:flagellar hook-basal body complex protein FliE [Stenotrophomonas sp. MYb238]|uniref:flagellar hook-basal body complex protein FliE n=1 Tax=Stenotrophomonas sp. MYb238 TaxID=2040281 RepID=UPI00129223DB|nr:flagellar hook-basal body complex protein FliE [Stenotrophomonas sp. MYb238]MQP74727.1 flagellar hook-basal body complex protein FliE [Stenotrophomonas sp. MYb238]
MSIEAIGALGTSAGVAETQASARIAHADFSAVVGLGLEGVDGALKGADQTVRAVAAGQEIATHDVMISLEQARMRLMLLAEVRNRVVEAYQELSRMQL